MISEKGNCAVIMILMPNHLTIRTYHKSHLIKDGQCPLSFGFIYYLNI